MLRGGSQAAVKVYRLQLQLYSATTPSHKRRPWLSMRGYEDNTAFLGEWGPFQQTVFFLLCASTIPNGFSAFSIIFLGDSPPHHCFVPDSSNLSEVWRKAIIPIEVVNGQEEESKCSRYRLDVVRNLSALGYIPGLDVNLTGVEQECCVDGWSYSKDIYQSTIVTEVSIHTFSLYKLLLKMPRAVGGRF